MEVNIIGESKSKIEIEIVGEDDTLCNALRNELWNHNVELSAYKIEHPLMSNPNMVVEGSGNLRKKFVSSCESLRKLFKEIKENFDKAVR